MTDLFISYSRRDLDFVRRIYDQMKAQNRDIWIDLEDIPPTAEWLQEIYSGIEAANTFVFVISPNSAVSDVCRMEIEHAVKHNKKLVPILHEDVPDRTLLHKSLASHNWLFFRDEDEFDHAFKLLNDALDTDLSYVRFHTRLLVRALEWESRGKDTSFLLRGVDLSDAEKWLSESMGKQPVPTQLHTQYIFASRQAETMRQRYWLIGVTAALMVSIVLGAIAFVQWREADAARLKASQAQGTAVAALISVNDTRSTAQAQEDTFRATIRALGVAAGEQGNTTIVPASEPEVTVLSDDPGNASAVQLTATALATFYEERVTQVAQGTLPESTSLPDTGGGGGDYDAGLLASVAAYEGAQTDAERFEAKTMLVSLLQNSGQPFGRVLRGHNGPVLAVSYSPDGSRLASASDDNTIILWDAASLDRVGLPFYGHSAGVTSLAFSPDGRLLASASRDSSIILWDVVSGEIVRRFIDGDTAGILSVAFSADGTRLYSSGANPVVKVWDVAAGTVQAELAGLDVTTFSITASPDGRLIAGGDSYGTIIVWDANTGAEVMRLAGHEGAVFSLEFSPDSSLLATAGADNQALIWDVARGQLLHSLVGANNVVLSVAFSADGQTLAMGTAENLVRLWDVNTGALVGDSFKGYGDWVYSVAFSPDGGVLASGSSDGNVVIWPVGIDAWKSQACAIAGRNLSQEEWADFFPNWPYREICPA